MNRPAILDDSDPFSFLDGLPDDLDSAATVKTTAAPIAPAGHKETCPKCHGTGKFRSWAGRIVGDCLKCKGKGFRIFATDAATRELNREKAAATKARKSGAAQEQWAAENPDAWAWIARNSESFPFAASMREAIGKYGSLTDRQLAAVWRCIESNKEREQRKADEKAERDARALPLDVSPLTAAFDHARNTADPDKRVESLKLRFAGFNVSPAKASSANAGALYVKTSPGGTYLGKIADGRFFQSRDCTPELESQFRAVCTDPKGAAIRYGKETGSCSCCGRTLTNPESIAAGIGPICAGRFGW